MAQNRLSDWFIKRGERIKNIRLFFTRDKKNKQGQVKRLFHFGRLVLKN
jgi:hypothetical protein